MHVCIACRHSNHTHIITHREKAPFLLYVEVINGDPEDDRHTEGALSPQFPLSPHMSFIIPNPDTPILPPPPQLQTPPTQQGGVGAGGAPGGPPGVSPGVRSPPPGGASGVGQGHYAAPSGSSSKGGPAGGGDPVEDDEDPFTRCVVFVVCCVVCRPPPLYTYIPTHIS